MKQFGSLANVIAKRKDDVALVVYKGIATVSIGTGPDRKFIITPWYDDERVMKIIMALNHGSLQEEILNDKKSNDLRKVA